jgi:hypothetical protein
LLRLFVRRSNDVDYFTNDPAYELEGLRDGAPGWWLRGSGDTRSSPDVRSVFATTERSAVHGYDIVVAAARPISILIALDPAHAPGVVDAHRVSVAASIDYLEQRALVVRDRRGGLDRDEPARWSAVVGYTHGVNRHGEPHLHDHVLVGARPKGARNVLDSRALFAHVRAADALYCSSLRHELAQRTPWRAWRSFKGIEHVQDLDEGMWALWGGHHEDRGAKLAWQRSDALKQWRDDLGRFEAQGSVSPPRGDRDELDEHAFAGALEGRSDVARRHVVAAWANAARFGQAARDTSAAIDRLYPTLSESRGIRESTIGLAQARMIGVVRERGPRPLGGAELADWVQRSRERSGSWMDRSR